METKLINSIPLPTANPYQSTSKVAAKSIESQDIKKEESQKSNFSKATKFPYVAGAILLAGIGIYAARNKLFKIPARENFDTNDIRLLGGNLNFKNPHTENAEDIKIIIPENFKLRKKLSLQAQKFDKHDPDIVDILPEVEEVVKKTAQVNKTTEPLNTVLNVIEHADSVFTNALNSINVNNKAVIQKIVSVRTKQMPENIRIINENIKNGHVDLNIMNKVARDFANDKTGRGADRFHQAAEILEQSLIKEFVKGDKKEMNGLQNIFDRASQNSPLFEIYKKMPLEEAASRLRYLADNDLKSASYKGMDSETFFEKCFNRLVEKIQFQSYNDAHGIKSEF